jgi:sugar O-acyltransferase (sialic acid O-acetyltransferase NeuD family)
MTAPRKIVVLADSGFGKCAIAAAQLAGYLVEAAYDDDASRWGGTMLGVPIVGPLERAVEARLPAVVAIIDPAAREAVVSRLPLQWATIVHPRSFVPRFVALDVGTILFAGVVVQPGVRIGAHVIVSPNVTVAHDCVIDDFVYLAPGVDLAGTVHVCQGAFLDAGAIVGPNRTIGAGTRVGPRGVVIRDLPAGVSASGAPARVVSDLA